LESESSKQNLGKLIDDCFYVKSQKWGTWDSYDKDGKCIITSLTEEQCICATRWYLKRLQEGFDDVSSYNGNIDYKL
jgi:hypothetical protein